MLINNNAYRYGYDKQIKLNEFAGIGNYVDFSDRGLNTRIGRFETLDQLYEKYPSNTGYGFAQDNPISGIDLEGKEYLDANVSRLEVTQGRVRLKLGNFSTNYQNSFRNKFREDSYKLDYPDPSLGGTPKPNPLDVEIIGTEQQQQAYQKMLHPNHNAEEEKERVEPVEANTNDEPVESPAGGTAASAAAIAGINVINYALQLTVDGISQNDNNKLNDAKKAVRSAFDDVLKGASMGMIPSQNMNIHDLSQIMNVVLQGRTTEGNQQLYQVGINIVDKISKNLKPQYIKTFVPSGLDGVPGTTNYIQVPVNQMQDPGLNNGTSNKSGNSNSNTNSNIKVSETD